MRMSLRRKTVVTVVALFVFGQAALADVPAGPCHHQQASKPQRHKGGESFGPLPLPVTPLRRSEKKRPPSPPPLIAKIHYGGQLDAKDSEGTVYKYYDWNKDPRDIPNLLSIAGRALNVRYGWKQAALGAFPTDPAQYPIYYYTGSSPLPLADGEAERLREFLRNGGTIWGETCFGDPQFFESFIRQMNKVLPGKPVYRLPADHPLYHCVYDISSVEYLAPVPDAPNGEPVFYGVDLGCRTAVILSRYDISCGWDGHTRAGSLGVKPNDARKLGVNMIGYALATARVAQYQSVAKLYYEAEDRARGDFVFSQAMLGPNWDTQPNAIANLLKIVATKTSTEVKFNRRAVDLAQDDLLEYPFLYLTGHDDFRLSDAEVAAVRKFVANGGFILGSACCGRPAFDAAFRREIRRVVPEGEMVPLAPTHPVYTMLYGISSVEYNDYVSGTGEKTPALPLEGIDVGGVTAVVYCSYDLGGGWRGFDHPFSRGVAHDDALRLGVNIILYSMTH